MTALASDLPVTSLSSPSLFLPAAYASQQTASHSTVQSLRKGHHLKAFRELNDQPGSKLLSKRVKERGPSKVDRRNALARERNSQLLSVDVDSPPASAETEAALIANPKFNSDRYQLQFLNDPLQLAQATLARLRRGDVEGSLRLVRHSDKSSIPNIVAWNHIIDYQMSPPTWNPVAALKTYNEMKKRGHKPDAHTYTILLSGFADPKNIQSPQAVQKALGVYWGISAPNSAVKENIIHTNAIVNVCARAVDLDALWSVVSKLPEHGPGAPDKWTFTTIFNALSANAQKRASALSEHEDGRERLDTEKLVRSHFNEALADGRKLWEDVRGRWRDGDLKFDEALVCAYGRLLLLGSRENDWRDIFELAKQTMQILQNDTHDSKRRELPEDPTQDDQPPKEEFSAVAISQAGNKNAVRPVIHAEPGRNTLSLLLQAAWKLRDIPAGKHYWDLLTSSPHSIKPDSANITNYLQLLRVSRSSKAVVDLLRQLAEGDEDGDRRDAKDVLARRGTYVLAMSTCARDKRNRNVFDYASRIVDMMRQKLVVEAETEDVSDAVDPRVLEMYVNLAVATTPGLSQVEPWKEGRFDARGNNVMAAIERLKPDVATVKEALKRMGLRREVGDPRPARMKDVVSKRQREELDARRMGDMASFLQAMVGVYDTLLRKHEVLPRRYVEDCVVVKRQLSGLVTRIAHRGRGGGSGSWGDSREGLEEDEELDMRTAEGKRPYEEIRREREEGRMRMRERNRLVRRKGQRGEQQREWRRDFPNEREVREERRRRHDRSEELRRSGRSDGSRSFDPDGRAVSSLEGWGGGQAWRNMKRESEGQVRRLGLS